MECNAPDEQKTWRSSPDGLIKEDLTEKVAAEKDTEGSLTALFFLFVTCAIFLLWWRKLVLTKFPSNP